MENQDQLSDSIFGNIVLEAYRLGNTGLMSSQDILKYLTIRLEQCLDVDISRSYLFSNQNG